MSVRLPGQLRSLAAHEGAFEVRVIGPVTLASVLDALEAEWPMLRGTLRAHVTKQRRPMVRFFVCREDWSHVDPATPLPDAVVHGEEPLYVLGAMAGG